MIKKLLLFNFTIVLFNVFVLKCKSIQSLNTRNFSDCHINKSNLKVIKVESLLSYKSLLSSENISKVSIPQERPPTRRGERPSMKSRFDHIGHLARKKDSKSASRCKMPGCKGKSRVYCVKCRVHLCLIERDCFYDYHQ